MTAVMLKLVPIKQTETSKVNGRALSGVSHLSGPQLPGTYGISAVIIQNLVNSNVCGRHLSCGDQRT